MRHRWNLGWLAAFNVSQTNGAQGTRFEAKRESECVKRTVVVWASGIGDAIWYHGTSSHNRSDTQTHYPAMRMGSDCHAPRQRFIETMCAGNPWRASRLRFV